MELRLEFASLTFKSNTNQLRKALEGLTREQLLATPGKDSSSMIWIAGHVVTARGLLARRLGANWEDPWAGSFRRGSSSKDSSKFPPIEEILDHWTGVSRLLAETSPSVTADQLAAKTPDGVPSYDGTVGGTVALLTFHESYHLGQMGYLRKWLGAGALFG